jgi:hypothetical protein
VTSAGDRGPSWVGRLDQVEWAKLDHAFGKATNVGALIKTIAFGDEEEARRACTDLDDELVHQASVYPSTYEAIPFLIEAVAETRAASVRGRMLALLGEIVSSCLHWMELEDSADDDLEYRGERWSPDPWIERIWPGSELFARFLRDDDDFRVRTLAAFLLGLLLGRGPHLPAAGPSGRYASAVAALASHLQSPEKDELVRSSVVFALGRASSHDPSLMELVRKAGVEPSSGEPTRVAAALAVMQIDNGRYANLQEADRLIDTMCRAAETDALYQVPLVDGIWGCSPWIRGRLRFTLSRALCDWSAGDRERMERVLPALLAGVRLTSGYVASDDLGPVFQWLWPDRMPEFSDGTNGGFKYVGPPPVTPKELTTVARRVVQACYDNPAIWEPPVGNTTLAFRHVGLPDTRDGLRRLLDETG